MQVQRATIKEINPIPDADMIVCYKLTNGMQVVWGKDKFELGEVVLYIQEASLIPQDLIEKLGLVGRLAGKEKNRVKAIKLKKTYSEGLIMKDELRGKVGNDMLDEHFGVTKHVEFVPAALSGAVMAINPQLIPPIVVKKDASEPSPEAKVVMITEKVHGTNIRIGKIEESHPGLFGKDSNIFVCSKGLGNKGHVFKNTSDNAYTRIFKRYEDWFESMQPGEWVIGEVFGKGVQDLGYGRDDIDFLLISSNVSDCRGLPSVPSISFEQDKTFKEFFDEFDVETLDSIVSYTPQIAEGVVATVEGFGFFKKVAQRYKLRKGGTEHN